MKGNRSASHPHRRLLLKYRLSHLIKFLSKYSPPLILQFLIKRGEPSSKKLFCLLFTLPTQVDLGNYSQVGASEKKEENGGEEKKKEEDEVAKDPPPASEKPKVRRMICQRSPHTKVQEAVLFLFTAQKITSKKSGENSDGAKISGEGRYREQWGGGEGGKPEQIPQLLRLLIGPGWILLINFQPQTISL